MNAEPREAYAVPTFRLDGRVAWITGASRGLGRALALGFAAAGAEVVLSARSAEKLNELADEIRATGGTAHVAPGSVADEADVAAAATLVRKRAGRLDVLVNNAGISPVLQRSERQEPGQWREIIDINLTGAFLASAAAAELLKVNGGSIINVSSVHGRSGHPRLAAYAASKGGMEALTRALATEWAPFSVRVNTVAPGYLETEMTVTLREHDQIAAALLERTPLARFATAEEVVPAVLFLAGDNASFITGATLAIDGGWTAR